MGKPWFLELFSLCFFSPITLFCSHQWGKSLSSNQILLFTLLFSMKVICPVTGCIHYIISTFSVPAVTTPKHSVIPATVNTAVIILSKHLE